MKMCLPPVLKAGSSGMLFLFLVAFLLSLCLNPKRQMSKGLMLLNLRISITTKSEYYKINIINNYYKIYQK